MVVGIPLEPHTAWCIKSCLKQSRIYGSLSCLYKGTHARFQALVILSRLHLLAFRCTSRTMLNWRAPTALPDQWVFTSMNKCQQHTLSPLASKVLSWWALRFAAKYVYVSLDSAIGTELHPQSIARSHSEVFQASYRRTALSLDQTAFTVQPPSTAGSWTFCTRHCELDRCAWWWTEI